MSTADSPDELETHELNPNEPGVFWRACRGLCYITMILLFDLKVYGVRNVPKRGGALLLSNHQSYLDPVLLGVKLPRAMSYLAKSELFANRFFAWLITSLFAFPIRQGRGDKGAMEETIRRLRSGHMLTVFPEGTRTEDGLIAPIQRGAALVVRRSGVPIVPAVIDGSFDAWPFDRKFPHPHPIRVLFGPQLHVEGLKNDQIIELIDRTLRQMFVDLRAGDVRKYEPQINTDERR